MSSPNNDAIIVYKVKRQDERRVFYLGSAPIDTGFFYCPYIPGATPEENAERTRYTPSTEFQLAVLKSVQDQPMLTHPLNQDYTPLD